MPTYQYACTACGEPTEAVQAFSDAPLTECPACGGLLRKVFSAVGVVFKGSGFYKNDSRKTQPTGVGQGDGPTKADGGGAADTAGRDKTDSRDKGGTPDKPAKPDTATSDKPASPVKAPVAKTA